jgi:hypothetical protein
LALELGLLEGFIPGPASRVTCGSIAARSAAKEKARTSGFAERVRKLVSGGKSGRIRL